MLYRKDYLLRLQIGGRGIVLPNEDTGILVCGDAVKGQSLVVRTIVDAK